MLRHVNIQLNVIMRSTHIPGCTLHFHTSFIERFRTLDVTLMNRDDDQKSRTNLIVVHTDLRLPTFGFPLRDTCLPPLLRGRSRIAVWQRWPNLVSGSHVRDSRTIGERV
jgi:hypothetical protein